MAYYRTTQFNPGPPSDINDTTIVYLEADDPGQLLTVSIETHNKPVKEYEEVSKAVHDANI